MPAPRFDKSLWFMHLGCVGRHYLLGNPHTVPGRMWAWCPKEGCTHFISLSDVGRSSRAAAYWMAGFLHGNEPEPPAGSDGPPDYGSAEYRSWQAKARRFRKAGLWPRQRPVPPAQRQA